MQRVAPFTRKYSDTQRDAVVLAYVGRNFTAKEVMRLAALGDLEGTDGTKLAKFEITESQIRTYARRAKQSRAGMLESPLADLPNRDANEIIRRRLINCMDSELQVEESKKPGTRDLERLRQIARAMREARAMPDRSDPRPPKPGQKVDGERNGAETKGGLAGDILKAARQTSTPAKTPAATAPTTSPPTQGNREHSASAQSEAQHTLDRAPDSENGTTPGAGVRVLAERFGVALERG